ncbi:MAG: CpaE family protein [Phycisphaerae bacterium]
MAATLRVCVFDTDSTSADALREALAATPDVRIVGLHSAWAPLQDCVLAGGVDAVVMSLGAEAPNLMGVRRLAEIAPDCAIVGISAATDPESIIGAMRAGCAQYVRWPIDPADLRAAIDRVRATRIPVAATSKRVCVVGSSGGAGATTIACNLVIELAHVTTRRCAVIDLNLEFGDIACAFDCKPKYTVADVCRDGIEIDRTLIESAMHELPCNVSVLARPEVVLESRFVTPDAVDHALRVMGQMYPFVVVDLPRQFSQASAAALASADRVLIVTQLAVPFLQNATRIYEMLLHMGAVEDRLEVVLNRCNANFERITPEEVERHFGRPIFAIVPNDYRRVTTSRDLGHPIMTDSPNSPARLAIQTMARALASDHIHEDQKPAQKGLLSKLWKR